MPYVTSFERIAEKKGVITEKVKTAKMMITDGLAMDVISKYTGLSLKEIKELAAREKDN